MKVRRHLLFMSLFCGLLLMALAPAAVAQDTAGGDTLSVEIDTKTAEMMAGDWVDFSTVLHNDGENATPPLVAHLNVAAVKQGPYVDPEDWSPSRTRYVSPIQPGESKRLSWSVHALVEGEFATFVTVVSADGSFETTASAPLYLTVTPDNILPMEQVIPVVTIVPLFPLALVLLGVVYRRRRP